MSDVVLMEHRSLGVGPSPWLADSVERAKELGFTVCGAAPEPAVAPVADPPAAAIPAPEHDPEE